MPLPEVMDVARAFDAELRRSIETHEYVEVIRRNEEDSAYADSDSCASHDFCDANMVMLAAFAEVTGMTEDAIVRLTCGDGEAAEADGTWVDVWNAAWDRWKSMPKQTPELPEGASMTTAGEVRARCESEGVTLEEADPEWHGVRAAHPDAFPYIVWEDGSMSPWYGKGGAK